MPTLLFLHGFASAGSSGTAIQLRERLYCHGINVESPDLPIMPQEAMCLLRQIIKDRPPELIVATSMGALYGKQLRGIPRILVNPSFDMARSLTFGGLGKREFHNKRQDGARSFKVDKAMITQFREIQRHTFQGITPHDQSLVWGLFGQQDKIVNFQKPYLKAYGKAHFRLFQGEHYLNAQVLKESVMPLIIDLLGLHP